MVDSHIGATYSGMVADGLHIIGIARDSAQQHRFIFNEVKSIESVAKDLAAYMMQATQYGGIRPYAVSILIGGIDTQPRLFEIEPGASFLGYKADAIGSGKKAASDILVKEYKDNMPLDDAISLGVKIIKKVTETKVTPDNLDVGYIEDGHEFTILGSDEIAKYL